MLKKHWPDVPIIEDVKDVNSESVSEPITLISGGFPCQPFSVAGKRRGKEDDRYLWPEMLRVIQELKPTWVLGENVAGLASMAQFDALPKLEGFAGSQYGIGDIYSRTGPGILRIILEQIESLGYEVTPFIIPACGVNAPHRRYRIFIVAYSRQQSERAERDRSGEEQKHGKAQEVGAMSGDRFTNSSQNVADSECMWQSQPEGSQQDKRERPINSSQDVSHSNCPGIREQSKSDTGSGSEAVAELHCKDVAYSDKQHDDNGRHRAGKIFRERGETELRRGEDVSLTYCKGLEKRGRGRSRETRTVAIIGDWWSTEPNVGRVAHGVPHRVDRLKCLGNAVVPQQVYPILRAIAKIEGGA